MIVYYHRDFRKSFKKLSSKWQTKVTDAVAQFQENPFDPKLRNHALVGQMGGKRAFSVAGDMRVIFQQKSNYAIVLMVDVGTHNQVY